MLSDDAYHWRPPPLPAPVIWEVNVKLVCQRKAHAANRVRRAQDNDGNWIDVQPRPRLTWQDVFQVMTDADGCCHWCGADVGYKGTLDHLTRVADGGSNQRSNLVWSCLPCNRKGYWREPAE